MLCAVCILLAKLYNNSDKYAISEEKDIQMDEKNVIITAYTS